MKWVRCPKCRTVNDIDRYPMCDGCNGDLTQASSPIVPPRPAPPQRGPNVNRSASRDVSASKIMIAILSSFALFVGGFSRPLNIPVLLLALLVAASALLTLFARPGTAIHRVSVAGLGCFSAVGKALGILALVLLGIVVFLFVLCATGAIR